MLETGEREEMATDMFGEAAWLAGCMVHHSATAPAAFLTLIKRWREINFGEGEESTPSAARRRSRSRTSITSMPIWEKNTPEDVRAYMAQRWSEMRARMDDRP